MATGPGGKRSLGALVSRFSGSGLQLGAQAVINRLHGTTALGGLNLLVAWARVLGAVVGLGLPVRVLRVVSEHDASGDPDASHRFARRARALSLRLGVLLVLLVFATAGSAVWLDLLPASLSLVLACAVAGVAIAQQQIAAEGLKARQPPAAALFVEFSILPLVALLGGAAIATTNTELTAAGAAVLGAAGAVVGALVGVGLWGRTEAFAAAQPSGTATPPVEAKELAGITTATLLNISFGAVPILLLPLFGTVAEAGTFGLAQRMVALPTLVIVALGAIYTPRFARSVAQGDHAKVMGDLRRTQQLGLALFIPPALLFALVPNMVEVLVGELDPGFALAIRMILPAQLINAATGLSAELLLAGGQQRLDMMASGAGFAVLLLCSAALGPFIGTLGILVGYIAGLGLRHALAYRFACQTFAPSSTPTK